MVGSVAAQRFDEEGIARDLEDLRRLEVLARAHHGVVAALAEDGPVAPVRLATIFRDDDGVRTLLRERAEELTTLLDRLGTCREWGVKVWATGSPAPPEPAATPATTTNGPPGTAYLMRRRAEREAGSRLHAHGTALADRLHAALAGIAVAEQRLALQDASLSGRREEMLLNATYLVRREDEDAFRSTAGADGDEAHRRRLHGPVAAVLVRHRGRPVSAPARAARAGDELALVDLLDRLLAGGVVLTGEITISLADVDLIQVSLRALISSVQTLADAGDAAEAADA